MGYHLDYDLFAVTGCGEIVAMGCVEKIVVMDCGAICVVESAMGCVVIFVVESGLDCAFVDHSF